jgi:hypothetical protein
MNRDAKGKNFYGVPDRNIKTPILYLRELGFALSLGSSAPSQAKEFTKTDRDFQYRMPENCCKVKGVSGSWRRCTLQASVQFFPMSEQKWSRSPAPAL